MGDSPSWATTFDSLSRVMAGTAADTSKDLNVLLEAMCDPILRNLMQDLSPELRPEDFPAGHVHHNTDIQRLRNVLWSREYTRPFRLGIRTAKPMTIPGVSQRQWQAQIERLARAIQIDWSLHENVQRALSKFDTAIPGFGDPDRAVRKSLVAQSAPNAQVQKPLSRIHAQLTFDSLKNFGMLWRSDALFPPLEDILNWWWCPKDSLKKVPIKQISFEAVFAARMNEYMLTSGHIGRIRFDSVIRRRHHNPLIRHMYFALRAWSPTEKASYLAMSLYARIQASTSICPYHWESGLTRVLRSESEMFERGGTIRDVLLVGYEGKLAAIPALEIAKLPIKIVPSSLVYSHWVGWTTTQEYRKPNAGSNISELLSMYELPAGDIEQSLYNRLWPQLGLDLVQGQGNWGSIFSELFVEK
ncbi:hypothetical protein KCV07_g855, partial [Aureobasidium melanogenum]